MTLNVAKELAELRRMSVADLRSRYAEVFGEATNARHKDWLVKRLIWRIQAPAEGDLSERDRARAVELANGADWRRRPPRESAAPPPVPPPNHDRQAADLWNAAVGPDMGEFASFEVAHVPPRSGDST